MATENKRNLPVVVDNNTTFDTGIVQRHVDKVVRVAVEIRRVSLIQHTIGDTSKLCFLIVF